MDLPNLLYQYYSLPRHHSQDGGLMIYKSGWRPYRNLQQQQGGSFLSGLGSFLKSGAQAVGKVAAPLAKTLKPVAAKVGKKLIKIGMHTLKDWAQQKNLNDAIQDNLHHAGVETATEVEQHLDAPTEEQQQHGSGRKHKHKMIMTAVPKKRPRKRDCFDVL